MLFKPELAQAIADLEKTQTRRPRKKGERLITRDGVKTVITQGANTMPVDKSVVVPTKKEILFLVHLKNINFVERLKNIGNLGQPSDAELELMELRWLREDVMNFVDKLEGDTSFADLALDVLGELRTVKNVIPAPPQYRCTVCGGTDYSSTAGPEGCGFDAMKPIDEE